jgi:hypothetical protein
VDPQRFDQLTARQQLTLLIAMHIRNSLEDFHVAHLSDAQMKELNQLIRQATFDALGALDEPTDERREPWLASRAWLVMSIPPYWEVPDRSSDALPGFE